jgi:hypothetical protein
LPVPVDEPLPSPPGEVVLEPPMLPLEVPLEVPPAPLVLRPSSRRQRSFSSPVSTSQRVLRAVEPADEGPVVLLPLPIVLPLVLPPTLLPVLLPPTLLPLLPVLPLLPEVCAAAEIAKSAAAVAVTNSFKVMWCSCG